MYNHMPAAAPTAAQAAGHAAMAALASRPPPQEHTRSGAAPQGHGASRSSNTISSLVLCTQVLDKCLLNEH